MKTNFFILLVILAMGYGIVIGYNKLITPKPVGLDGTRRGQVEEPAPKFAFRTLDGTYYSLADAKGKIVLLNFWASWCAPCRKEFPELIRIAANDPDIILIALSSDIEAAKAGQFIDTLKTENRFPSVLPDVYIGMDEGQKITGSLYQTYKLPETLIIDREQIIRAKLVGASWTREDLQKILTPLR